MQKQESILTVSDY